MRLILRYIFSCAIIILLHSNSYAQYSPLSQSKDSIDLISKQDILNDLDEYANGIKRNHVAPFTCIKKSAFFDEIQRIKDSADHYDTDQLLIEWLKVNAMIGDEHTNILYTSRDVFPFTCYWFQEGIYIIRTGRKNTAWLGAQIVAVNDIPIQQVADKIATLSTDKNEAAYKLATCRYLFDPFVIHGLHIAPSREGVVYTVVTDRHDTVKIHPLAEDRRSMVLQANYQQREFLRYSKREPYWYKYDAQGNYIYFRYTKCYDDKEYPYKDVEKALLEDIDTKAPQKIIIDLRDNSGGSTRMFRSFIEHLARTPLNRKGHIYVLVGRKTFSAAILYTVALKTRTYAQVIGEETSGSVVHFGYVKFFTLPNTNFKVKYSTQYVVTDEKYDGSLRPDVVIPETFADYHSGVDAVLEYAITH